MKEIIHFLFVGLALGAWQDGADIKSILKQDEIEEVKGGSLGGDPDDHLTLLGITAGSVVIGARDKLHNFSLKNDLIRSSNIAWPVSDEYQESCQFKGQPDKKCHNFLRLFQGPFYPNHPNADESLSTKSRYLVCGTNAFKPTCRFYSTDMKSHSKDFSGVGYSPFDPTHQSTSVLHHDSVYAATVADFGGTDSLIYKRPLRTEQYYDLHLNNPSFVSSRSVGDLALFFFRENAVEHLNFGKAVYSRVARICRHDNGGKKHRDRFTTFLKARLNCSIPGEYPFYFDHIQGTTEIFSNNEEQMFYAVFTTPPNSIRASAVCSFYMKDILHAFDGPFKGQSSLDSNWLPVPESDVPNPRPGSCLNDTTQQPDSNSLAFLKGHPLMDEAVQGTAVLTLTSNVDTFTSLTVDNSSAVAPYHIIYVGTESGKVFKGIFNPHDNSGTMELNSFNPSKSYISQSWEVFPKKPIKSLHLINPTRLLVLTENEMKIIRVKNCDKFSSCGKCASIRDPHCGWDTFSQNCVTKNPTGSKKDRVKNLIEDIQLCPPDGHTNEINHPIINSTSVEAQKVDEECCTCSSSTTTVLNLEKQESESTAESDKEYFGGGGRRQDKMIILEPNENNDIDIQQILDSKLRDSEPSYVTSRSEDGMVSHQSVVLATTSSAVLSLLVGFSLGFLVCKLLLSRKNKPQALTNAQLSASLNESQRLTNKPIDVLVNVPAVNRNPMKNNLNTDTLEKTVKKIYL